MTRKALIRFASSWQTTSDLEITESDVQRGFMVIRAEVNGCFVAEFILQVSDANLPLIDISKEIPK